MWSVDDMGEKYGTLIGELIGGGAVSHWIGIFGIPQTGAWRQYFCSLTPAVIGFRVLNVVLYISSSCFFLFNLHRSSLFSLSVQTML